MDFLSDPEHKARLAASIRVVNRKRYVVLAVLGASAVVAVTLAHLLTKSQDSDLRAIFIPAMLVAGAVAFCLRWFQRQASAELIPHLARAAGLGYTVDFPHHIVRDMIEAGLIPRAGDLSRREDRFDGTLAGRHFMAGDVHLKTGGKNSSTLFEGLVVSLSLPERHKGFALTTLERAASGFLRRAQVDTKTLLPRGTFNSKHGTGFTAYVPDNALADSPGFRAQVKQLVRLDSEIPGCRLFSVYCTGDRILVALSSGRNLFRIGRVFSAELMTQDLQRVLSEMQFPLRVVQILLDAEQAALTASAGSVPPAASGAGHSTG